MLNQKIQQTIALFRNVLSSEQATLIEQGAGEISALDIVENALGVDHKTPDFQLTAYDGTEKALASYLSAGPLVLTFYRGVWCPYCNLQLKEYDDRLSEITDLGAQLVAITPEKPGAVDVLEASEVHRDVVTMAVREVGFDILHDAGNRLARQFGLVFELPQSHRRLLDEIGVDIEVLTGDDTFVFPDPATYVITPDAVIRWAFVPNNYRKRAEVDDIIRVLRDLISRTNRR